MVQLYNGQPPSLRRALYEADYTDAAEAVRRWTHTHRQIVHTNGNTKPIIMTRQTGCSLNVRLCGWAVKIPHLRIWNYSGPSKEQNKTFPWAPSHANLASGYKIEVAIWQNCPIYQQKHRVKKRNKQKNLIFSTLTPPDFMLKNI